MDALIPPGYHTMMMAGPIGARKQTCEMAIAVQGDRVAAPASRGQSVMPPVGASRTSPNRKTQRKKIGRALPAPAFEVYALADVFRTNFRQWT